MSPQEFTVAEAVLDLDMRLGEGCVWDTRRACLWFVDIDKGHLYVYDPRTSRYGHIEFDKKITAIALSEDDDSLIAALDDCVVRIEASSLPTSEHDVSRCKSQGPSATDATYTVLHTTKPITLNAGEARLNEGAVDPVGRFLFGSMTFDQTVRPSRLYSLRPTSSGPATKKWDAPIVHNSISVTNGMAWCDSGRRMYFTDSHPREILLFDYDLTTGAMSNRQIFSRLSDEFGYPDGLCLDDQGGVWSARWEAGKVVRLDPKTGLVTVIVSLVNSWNVTCCIFGGSDLSDLYMTTAACDQGGPAPEGRKEAGKLYVLKDSGFRGVERGRFRWTA